MPSIYLRVPFLALASELISCTAGQLHNPWMLASLLNVFAHLSVSHESGHVLHFFLAEAFSLIRAIYQPTEHHGVTIPLRADVLCAQLYVLFITHRMRHNVLGCEWRHIMHSILPRPHVQLYVTCKGFSGNFPLAWSLFQGRHSTYISTTMHAVIILTSAHDSVYPSISHVLFAVAVSKICCYSNRSRFKGVDFRVVKIKMQGKVLQKQDCRTRLPGCHYSDLVTASGGGLKCTVTTCEMYENLFRKVLCILCIRDTSRGTLQSLDVVQNV